MLKTKPELFRMTSQFRKNADDVSMAWERGRWQLILCSGHIYHVDRSAWDFEIGLWYMDSSTWISRPTMTKPSIRIDRRVPAVMVATWLVNELNNAVYSYIEDEWTTFAEQFGWKGRDSTVTLTDEDVTNLYRKSDAKD